jgi:hypothetical protein
MRDEIEDSGEAPRYRSLPAEVQALADKAFALLKSNPRHPSLHHKRVREFHSVRVGLFYRALGIDVDDAVLWCGLARMRSTTSW